MVRCGACRTQFDVPGPGRFSCPRCGSVNMVRGAPGAAPESGGNDYPPPPPSPPPDPPSPKIQCPDCEFTFIVGKIATAKCPNCGYEVATGEAEPAEVE